MIAAMEYHHAVLSLYATTAFSETFSATGPSFLCRHSILFLLLGDIRKLRWYGIVVKHLGIMVLSLLKRFYWYFADLQLFLHFSASKFTLNVQ